MHTVLADLDRGKLVLLHVEQERALIAPLRNLSSEAFGL